MSRKPDENVPRTKKSTPTITASFVIDDAPKRKAWPVHGSIEFTDGITTKASPMIYSMELGRMMIDGAVNKFHLIDADNATVLEAELKAAGLTENISQSDRFFREYSGAEWDAVTFYERLMGFIPGEPGSHDTHTIVNCTGACGHKHCARYAKHGLVYVRGHAEPVSLATFSQGGLTQTINGMIKKGLIAEEDRKSLLTAAQKIELPAEIRREDRLIQIDPEYLDITLGLRNEDTGGNARFELCSNCGAHGSFYAAGKTKAISEPTLSIAEGEQFVAQAVENGYYTTEEAERVKGQLKMSGLMEEDPVEAMFQEMEAGGQSHGMLIVEL